MTDVAETDPVPTARHIRRPARLPGSRAVVGALLMTLAAVGTFASYAGAADRARHRYAVVARDLDAGAVVTAADVRLVPMTLPDDVAAGAFDVVDDVVGRRTLAPLAAGDLVQATVLTEPSTVRGYEVTIAVPRSFAFAGLLRRGDLVDVFVTYDDEWTATVASQVRVLAVPDAPSGGLTSADAVTVALEVTTPRQLVALVHAAHAAEITLVRSTHAGTAVPPDVYTPERPLEGAREEAR